jgi:hypothetical protein
VLPIMQTVLVSMPVHQGQKKGTGKGPSIRPPTFRIPAYVDELKALLRSSNLEVLISSLSSTISSAAVSPEQEGEAFLLPNRMLASPDQGSFTILFDLVPSKKLLQHSLEVDTPGGASGAAPMAEVVFSNPRPPGGVPQSLLYLNLRTALTAEGRQTTVAYAGAAADAAFLSSRHLALLEDNGRRVTLLALDGDQPTSAWRRASETTLERPASRLFAAPEGLGGRPIAALYVIRVGGAADAQRMGPDDSSPSGPMSASMSGPEGPQGHDALVMSRVDGLALGLEHDSPHFAFGEGESVEQIVWQTTVVYEQQSLVLAGLVTNRRVLLLSSSLLLLAEVALPAPVVSVTWLSAAFLLAMEDGHVHYLVPGQGQGDRSFICALDRQRVSGGLSLVSALPDRLVYAFRVGNGMRIGFHPLLPLEPLIVSGLALPSLAAPVLGKPNPPFADTALTSYLRGIVERYGPLGMGTELASAIKYNPGEGPGRNAGATIRASLALCQAGLFQLASAISGVMEDARMQGAEAFRKRPWLPVELKAGIAAANSTWREAMAEELADDPGMQEYSLNPNSFQNAQLPIRFKRISRGLAALGDDAQACGQFEAALRLYDTSGEDEDVVSLLALHGAYGNPEAAGLLRELFQAKAVPHLKAYAALVVQAAGASTSAGAQIPPTGSQVLNVKLAARTFPFACQRRASLLPSSPGQELTSWDLKREVATAVQTVGPPLLPLLQRLLLDRPEEWVGRLAPEVVEEENESGGAAGVASEGMGADEWVKGVGQGREEEDNLVGYWRFSELAQAEGGSHRLQGDLSNYANVFEVISDVPNAVSFNSSLSPVDQGDEAKVRPAVDVTFAAVPAPVGAGQSGKKHTRGLLLRVKRGSALDIGVYHTQANRAKLTFEVWSYRPDLAAGDARFGQLETLAARTTEDETRIWTFGIDREGAVLFHPGENAGSLGGAEDVKSPPATVELSKWNHLAFVLECKGKIGAQGSVVLYLNGREIASGNVKFPALPESRLKETLLFFGPNLRGHALTELRIWALSRSADDLYDNRESYLKLAEKRKRLAFKIKAQGTDSPVADAPKPGPVLGAEGSGLLGSGLPGAAPGGGRRRRTMMPDQAGSPTEVPATQAQSENGLLPPGGALPLSIPGPTSGASRPRRATMMPRGGVVKEAEETESGSATLPGPGLRPPGGTAVHSRRPTSAPAMRVSLEEGADEESEDVAQADTGVKQEPSQASPEFKEPSSRTDAWGAEAVKHEAKGPAPALAPTMVISPTGGEKGAGSGAFGLPPPSGGSPRARRGTISTSPSENARSEATEGSTRSRAVSHSVLPSSNTFEGTSSPPFSVQARHPPLSQGITPNRGTPVPAVAAAFTSLFSLAETGVDVSTILGDQRSSMFSPGGDFLCVRERPPGSAKVAVSVITISGQKRARYAFQAESAVLNGDAAKPLIACYTTAAGRPDGLLQVYDLEGRKGIAQQPIATHMLFWRWISYEQLALVTPRAVFQWGVTGGVPQKLFDRQDLELPGHDGLLVTDFRRSSAGTWSSLALAGGAQSFLQLHSTHLQRTFLETNISAADIGEGPEPTLVVVRPHGPNGSSPILEVYQLNLAALRELPVTAKSLLSGLQPTSTHVLPDVGGARSPAVLLPSGDRKQSVVVLCRESGGLYFLDLSSQTLAHVVPSMFSASRQVRAACLDQGGDLVVLDDQTFTLLRVEVP